MSNENGFFGVPNRYYWYWIHKKFKKKHAKIYYKLIYWINGKKITNFLVLNFFYFKKIEIFLYY